MLLISNIGISAQDIVIIGQVFSSEDATPLEAAHVWFKGTDIGTTTNQEGYFLLRSKTPQKTLVVSVVGYRHKEIKLDYGKDQVVQVFLRVQTNLIDEIIIIPGENPAYKILRKVDENKFANNPDNLYNIQTEIRKETDIYLTDIKQKAFQRKLFSDLSKGAVKAEDSSYIVPVYIKEDIIEEQKLDNNSVLKQKQQRQNFIEILPKEHWESVIDTYIPKVNFYRTYITLFNRNFVSPLAKQATTYYHFSLIDSICENNSKQYRIDFKPKNDKLLLFKGSMMIDSATSALTSINAQIPYSANINFVNDMVLYQKFDTIEGKYYYKNTDYSTGLSLNLAPGVNRQFWGAVLNEKSDYYDIKPIGDSVSFFSQPIYSIPESDENHFTKMWNNIDSVNQTRIRRLAYWLVDIGINEYLHLWKFDVGPLLNLYHYNRLEGHSPRLTLRTGEKMMKNFTIGGYFGYGTYDKKFKYGGELQWKFGPKKNNTLSLFYDRKTVRYGYDDFSTIHYENMVEDVDHLINTFFYIFDKKDIPEIGLREQISLKYRYENDKFRLITEAYGQKTYSNMFMPYICMGKEIPYYEVLGLKMDYRFSWDDKKVNYFFHPYYILRNKPIIHLNINGGIVNINNLIYPFSKFTVAVKHQFPLFFGKMFYLIEGVAIAGRVPFPLLYIPRGGRNWYYNKTEFVLMQQMEFMSDLYIGGSFRYQTPGWLFGIIPGVKQLDLRESLMFNIAYGGLRENHKNITMLPTSVQPFDKMPYMECGIGISNILRIFTVESVWRLTHRNSPLAINWGVRFRVDFDF